MLTPLISAATPAQQQSKVCEARMKIRASFFLAPPNHP